MVIRLSNGAARRRGALMIELLVAMGILAGILIPLGWSVISERRLARALYQRAVAMEILDGEMETLVAGEWRSFRAGRQDYAVHAQSATNLPRGVFSLTVEPGRLRLEWKPAVKDHGGALYREARIR
jgi:hypothetical protein